MLICNIGNNCYSFFIVIIRIEKNMNVSDSILQNVVQKSGVL